MERTVVDMDKSMAQEKRPRPHHHRAADLPRHWITLPIAARRAAQHHPLLAPLFPSHVGFFPRARRHKVERPGIDTTIVNYCVKGTGWCELGGRRFVVEAGDLMVVPSGVEHAYGAAPTQPWTLAWFHAMGTSLPALLLELGTSSERPVVRVGHRRDLVALFSELRTSLENDYSAPQLLYASRVLAHLFGLMIRSRQEATQPGRDTLGRVRSTLEYMRHHYASPLSVETLAAMADLSRSQYAIYFRKLTGRSPKNHLMRLRIHLATQLLDTTSDSITHIARSVGYEDPLYFSRAFRQLHELSPSRYRGAKGRSTVE
jgi:AraC family transcriptional regulator of arabinose operon